MKDNIKKRILENDGPNCNLCEKSLPVDLYLIDTHRLIPRSKGGIYEPGNDVLLHPWCHMKFHGNEPNEQNLILKEIVGVREQVMKERNRADNQIRAYNRGTDILSEDEVRFTKKMSEVYNSKLKKIDSVLKSVVKELAESDSWQGRLVKSAIGVRGVGGVTIAYCQAMLDFDKARYPSSFWAYSGYHVANHERYKKNVAGGGSQKLRTVLFTFADSQIKCRGAYRSVYDDQKHRRQNSSAITKTRVAGKKGTVDKAWKDVSDGHRHGDALRKVAKNFLADYWYVGKTLRGESTEPLYCVEKLGNHQAIMSKERGWIF